MIDTRSVVMVAIIACVTMFLRIIPFMVFGKNETPKYISYLGNVLPYAIMGMLVVYCLKNVSPLVFPYGIPELAACAIVVLMHIWRRNTLLSILSGTVVYMFLIQVVF